jgi:NSS family neurotransmitter:Na+ symporter
LGGVIFLIGTWSSFSFNSQAELYLLNFGIFAEQNPFGIIDVVTGKILLPVSALLVAIFVGWIADKRLIDEENGMSGTPHIIWRFLIAWLCPLVIGAILITGLFPQIVG